MYDCDMVAADFYCYYIQSSSSSSFHYYYCFKVASLNKKKFLCSIIQKS